MRSSFPGPPELRRSLSSNDGGDVVGIGLANGNDDATQSQHKRNRRHSYSIHPKAFTPIDKFYKTKNQLNGTMKFIGLMKLK